VIAVAALVGVGVGVYFLWPRPPRLPARGSQAYLEYQRAFQVGTAALDAGRDDLALKHLDRAVELVPGEPAGWANRGLYHLRKNNIDLANKDLKRANELAPECSEIEALLGMLADKQGDAVKAVAHFRKAVEQRPDDLPSVFALAEMISKKRSADSEAEYQRLMEQILKAQPNNLPVLVKRGGAALRRKDQAAYDDTLARFDRLAPTWKPETREKLDVLRKTPTDRVSDALEALVFFDNMLRAEHGYARDSLAVNPRAGESLQRFLRLEPARATPASPDRALSFKIEKLPSPQETWSALRPLWLINERQHQALTQDASRGGIESRPAEVFQAALLVAHADAVRRLDADAPTFAFPGGAKKTAPSSAGILTIDWDNDFLTDLVLAGAGGIRFWQQKPAGAFVDVTAKTTVKADIVNGDYFGAWAADIDLDGDLDIIAARRSGSPVVLRNNRDGTFQAMELFPSVKDARAFVWADLDNDGAADAVFLDAAGKLHVFANDRSGQFSPWKLPGDIGMFIAITAADVNGDGVFDLIGLRANGTLVRISDQDKRRAWQVVELARGPALDDAVGSVAVLADDLDNNGAIDLLIASPKSTHVCLADDAGKFELLPMALPLQVTFVRDVNGDGRLDLVGLSPEGKPMRAINEGRTKYHWQTVWPLANPKVGDNRINTFAIGGEVEVRSGPLVQKQLIHGPVVHFGLGEQPAIDVARIIWPNGAPQWEFELAADRIITAAQRLTGSCPFLFTFDGAGMRFAGDFMWGTPLGMYVNGQNIGDFPQTTEWLKIPGDALIPKDGYFDIRVQANLWETDYFDQLALVVVDHPPNTEIHVDERFFLTPPEIAKKGDPALTTMRVTTPVKPVAKAWDHHGKDATAEVRALDGVYLDRAGRGRFQGITQDHWIEIDLGDDAPADGPVLLVARGWLHPTNSSINVAIAQGKHSAPRPLSIEIPDGNGGWKVADPALGFPAGKNKTMLIRLDELGEPGGRSPRRNIPRRLRVRTNMEIYWDFIGYATELDPKLARLHRPSMTAADLRPGGILEMTQKNASSPEVPIYDKVIRDRQEWRDLTGYYTRFGDVRELLARVDDRYVIMNAGDEIALRFAVPVAPPAGWKRDFIWECDGWTRDGDLNTKFGNSVQPLPMHGKRTDARPPTRLVDDPVYRRFPRDWQMFHTRYVTDSEFARGLRR